MDNRTTYNACDAMDLSKWWSFHFAFHAVVCTCNAFAYSDFQLACEDGIVFG